MLKEMKLENRIELLKHRTGKDNHNIVRKLERQLRNLRKVNDNK